MIEDLATALLRYTALAGSASPYGTPIDGMLVLRNDHPRPPVHRIFKPCLCVVAQGAKWASFGEKGYSYQAGQALIVGVDTPSAGRVVEASPDKPCLVLVFELDRALMREVAEQVGPPLQGDPEASRGVFVTDVAGSLAASLLRLVQLLDTPEAIPVLQPLIMREILYWLLKGPQGGLAARLVLADSPSRPLMEAIHTLRLRFSETVRIDTLAAEAGLSASAFHRQFKRLTAFTPLQYQKQLRLLEARRLMLSQGTTAEAAAFAVGYESASQFSREYARLFGAPPRQHVKTALRASSLGAQAPHSPPAGRAQRGAAPALAS